MFESINKLMDSDLFWLLNELKLLCNATFELPCDLLLVYNVSITFFFWIFLKHLAHNSVGFCTKQSLSRFDLTVTICFVFFYFLFFKPFKYLVIWESYVSWSGILRQKDAWAHGRKAKNSSKCMGLQNWSCEELDVGERPSMIL